MEATTKRKLGVTVSEEVHQRLDQLSAELNVSKAEIIEAIVRLPKGTIQAQIKATALDIQRETRMRRMIATRRRDANIRAKKAAAAQKEENLPEPSL
ncbi:ribbon-helix-helix protein, CopG family [Oxalobacter sp. OttesenSCG-928-P03]|nr:ribbon-helix-helix protein, CopG family [Oxalobacter sp. OttesenSCG-928-P03]